MLLLSNDQLASWACLEAGGYGWWNNLVCTLAGGVYLIFVVFWEVGRGHIGFVAPWRFKIHYPQAVQPNMGAVSIDFHDLRQLPKSCHAFLA